MSQPSLSKAAGDKGDEWTELERCLFEERAAIMEYEGGLPRELAEYFAAREVDHERARLLKGTGPF